MLKTDWLKVATAGRTVDGREIKPDWLEKMAGLYSPQVYTATVNSEHFFYPGLGHVTELRSGKDGQGRTALYARIAPTAELLTRYQNRRQLFFSVEVMPDFPAKGDFYLSGLAITDLPASQGLEPTRFSGEGQTRRRFFDTSCITEDGADDIVPADEAEPAPAETPPGWWTALWGALRPHFAAGARRHTQENEAMTDEERQAFQALEAEVERLGAHVKEIAERPETPVGEAADGNDDPRGEIAAEIDARIAAALEPITATVHPLAERIAKVEAYMAEPIDGERGEVTGPAEGGEAFIF